MRGDTFFGSHRLSIFVSKHLDWQPDIGGIESMWEGTATDLCVGSFLLIQLLSLARLLRLGSTLTIDSFLKLEHLFPDLVGNGKHKLVS